MTSHLVKIIRKVQKKKQKQKQIRNYGSNWWTKIMS